MQLNKPGEKMPSSFTNREKIAEAIKVSKEQAKKAEETAPAIEQTPDSPVEEPKATEEKKLEEKRHAEFLKLKAQLEESLGIMISDNDVRDMIFKQRIVKDVTIIPGFLVGSFRTLVSNEIDEIDRASAAFNESSKTTPQGEQNERSKIFLSFGWLSAGEPGGPLKPLGSNNTERRASIDAMSADVIEEAWGAYSNLSSLIRLVMRSRTILKKS